MYVHTQYVLGVLRVGRGWRIIQQGVCHLSFSVNCEIVSPARVCELTYFAHTLSYMRFCTASTTVLQPLGPLIQYNDSGPKSYAVLNIICKYHTRVEYSNVNIYRIEIYFLLFQR